MDATLGATLLLSRGAADSPMMGDVVQVQLCIPVGRIDAASWLKQQSPGLVADCLSECQSNYEAKLAANADHKVRQVEDECKQRLAGVKEQYDDDLARLQRANEQLQLQVAAAKRPFSSA